MAGFTDEEIQAAVDRFLYKQVTVTQLKTGARDVITARDRVYDLLTTALLLRPDAYFYVIYLAKNRLSALLSKQIAALDEIIAAGPNTTRAAAPIKTTAELANAQAALLDLTAGLNTRTTGIRGSIGPAVERFRRSVSSFVSSELTKNVVVAGSVTSTGPELRAKVAKLWAESAERHAQTVELAASVSSALSTLESVRLPESSVRDIVQRINDRLTEVKELLEGREAIEQSREALLELLTMRTLLTKASTFKNPAVLLMPLRSDTRNVVPIDSPGTEAQLTGTISGPFNYAPGASFAVSFNGTPYSVAMPRPLVGSRAELRSRQISPWVPPVPGDEAAFELNLGGTVSMALAAYADGPTAALALTAGLPGIAVSWEASTSRLVFQSTVSSDISNLRLLSDTAPRLAFRDWAFPATEVFRVEARGEAVPANEVVDAIAAVVPVAEPAVETTALAAFRGTRSTTPGDEAILWHIVDSGTGVTTDLVNEVVSPSRNFRARGVRAGMGIHLVGHGDFSIVAVEGDTLTVDATSLPAGPLTYFIGPDYRALPAGARVKLTSGGNSRNSGLYRLLSGSVGRLTLDRNIPAADTGLLASVFTEYVVARARGTTTAQSVGVLVGSAGQTAMGFAVSAVLARPALTAFQLQGAGDLLLRGARVGDVLTLTPPSGTPIDCEIASLTTDTVSVVPEDARPYESGAWFYTVRSQRGVVFEDLRTAADVFLADPYILEFAKLDAFMGRLIRGARFTGEVQQSAITYRASLAGMLQACQAYAVPFERTIDGVVMTMREQGFDRAVDLLLTLRIDELFEMDADGVSYSSWLIRNAATVAREVTPVSKYARSDRIIQEWRPVSFQPDPFDPRGETADP
jgi:hypothetical protein